ncbi:MAG: rRNA maturation RNase YbeY [Actinomycetes bacterium]
MTIDIANETTAVVDEHALVGVARHVLDRMGIHPLAELSVMLVDENAMEQLHVQWMDESGPTDVLAFPMDELRPANTDEDGDAEPGLLGDVVLCPTVAERQARAAGHEAQHELAVLTTHGILHLLGYDHGTPDEEREMFGLQRSLISSWRDAQAGETSEGRPR